MDFGHQRSSNATKKKMCPGENTVCEITQHLLSAPASNPCTFNVFANGRYRAIPLSDWETRKGGHHATIHATESEREIREQCAHK
jgi:hypothetical protein